MSIEISEHKDLSVEVRQSSTGRYYIGSCKVYGDNYRTVFSKLDKLVKAVSMRIDDWNNNGIKEEKKTPQTPKREENKVDKTLNKID